MRQTSHTRFHPHEAENIQLHIRVRRQRADQQLETCIQHETVCSVVFVMFPALGLQMNLQLTSERSACEIPDLWAPPVGGLL